MSVAIPFSEHPYLLNLPSPYYKDTHRQWQRTCRAFIQENLGDHVLDWERDEFVPLDVYGKFAQGGFLVPNLPAPLPIEWLEKLGLSALPGGLRAEDFDYFHFLIYTDEMLRVGLLGPPGAITTGFAFGVPPIYKFGSIELQNTFLPDLLLGRTRTCLAITEPSAGSDVANISTTAEKSECGNFYIVTGQKKWITNGIWCDYATMAVRTGGPDSGANGLSLLLVPLKNTEGVAMRRFKVAGHVSAGTTFIDLDEVKVPVSNLIGVENHGMRYIMTNFNHERLSICIGGTRQSRVALGAAMEYIMKREAFGKTLLDQPVVRHRLAICGAQVEAQWSWVEQMTYMMSKMKKVDADRELGGLTALVKAQTGRVLSECAQCAVLLFGGNGYTRTGQGELVERLYREVPGTRIPGGSEDVLLDLGVRQLAKNFKRKTAALKESVSAKL